MANYYDILGVPKGAGDDEIKKAYRKLAMQHHPDRNQGNKEAEEKFKQISEAYAVLSDPAKKKQYEAFGDQKFHQQYSSEDIFRGADFASIFQEFGMGGGGGGGDFSKVFGNMFGGRAGGGRGGFGGPTKGQDVEYDLPIGFMEAYDGGDRKLSFRLSDGSKREFTLKIPAGVRTGGRLKVVGKGAPSAMGGQDGDLFVVLTVGEHPLYLRDDEDIMVKVPLRLTEALLGCGRDVETPAGSKRIKIPEGVKPGTKIRLKGLGFPTAPGATTRGDLYAVVEYELPTRLSDEQRKLVESLAEAGM